MSGKRYRYASKHRDEEGSEAFGPDRIGPGPALLIGLEERPPRPDQALMPVQ